MINFKLTYWQVIALFLACVMCALFIGVSYGRLKQKLTEATAQRTEAQARYDILIAHQAAERERDSLRLVAITSENENIEQNIEQIRKEYERRRFEIGSLSIDSLLGRWSLMRARLDSIVTGQRWRDD